MRTRTVSAVAAVGLLATAAAGAVAISNAPGHQGTRFEVWIADQSDTRAGFGGQILIYEGSTLTGSGAAAAAPQRIDLGAETADLCRASTGSNPVRPHMILFNSASTHAVVSFVASGHVAVSLAAALAELEGVYETARTDRAFWAELDRLAREYVGRANLAANHVRERHQRSVAGVVRDATGGVMIASSILVTRALAPAELA